MLFLWNVSLLVALFCSNVLGHKIDLNHDLADRQIFTSVATSCTGTSCPTVSSTSSKISSNSIISSSSSKTSSSSALTTSSAPSSSPSPSSGSSTVSSTTSTTPSVSYNPYALTTTFTQPPACTGGFTAIEDWGTDIYDNLIFSSAGYNLTYTSCYPPQFYSSVLASIVSTTLPPFTALICPSTWENYEINSTYVICCPSGYSLLAPNYDDPTRPGADAVCSSYIGGGALMDITTFDLTGGETIVPMTAGPNGTVVWANAFDGFTTSVASTSNSSSLSTVTSTSSSSLPTTTSSTTSASSKIISSSTSTSSASASKTTSSSTPTSSSSKSTTTTLPPSTSSLTTTTGTAVPGESGLPACGITCFNNMLAQYSTLGCAPLDSYCLCSNVNFGYGIRDCSNGACGTAVASTVIAFGSAYCSSATATHVATTTVSTAVPGESGLPACGILCFNNMLAQYSTLGCNQLDSYCLCSNVNFGYGIRDCSNGACGTAVASTVIAFGSAYCSSATATHTPQITAAR